MIIKNNGNHIYHLGAARLIPGTNELNLKEFDSLQTSLSNPLNKVIFDKNIEIVESKGGNAAETIASLNANDAIKLINDSFDIALLEKWLNAEKRKAVKSAIENKIDEIKNPSEEKVVNPE